jgi:hypothetical protein
MKRRYGRIQAFFLFGGFVFLLTLFLHGFSRGYPSDHFFYTTDEIKNRLPFSIIAGVICGLVYAFLGKKNQN